MAAPKNQKSSFRRKGRGGEYQRKFFKFDGKISLLIITGDWIHPQQIQQKEEESGVRCFHSKLTGLIIPIKDKKWGKIHENGCPRTQYPSFDNLRLRETDKGRGKIYRRELIEFEDD